MQKIIYRRIQSPLRNTAFTLVELMVTISIFLIITTVTIVNYSDFKSNVSLQNNTDTIALSIRKAQSLAVGARGIKDNTGVADFNKSYGIHFSLNDTGSVSEGSNKLFLIFAIPKVQKGYDDTGDCGGTNSCIEYFTITSVDKIQKILIDGNLQNKNNESIDIIFTRPDLSARFCYRHSNGNSNSCETNISAVSIIISNGKTGADEKTKTITVQNTGQISIQ